MVKAQLLTVAIDRPNDPGRWITVEIEERHKANWPFLNSMSGRGYRCVGVTIVLPPPSYPNPSILEEFVEVTVI